MVLRFHLTTNVILPQGSFLFIACHAFFLVGVPVQAQSQIPKNPPPLELTENWQYRWWSAELRQRDSSINEAAPVWIYEDSSSDGWKPISYNRGIVNPPGRRGEKELWLRIELPEGQWRDPHIFIENVYFACDVYLDSVRIYRSEEMNKPGEHSRIYPIWHMIPVNFGYQNKTIFFRIYSEDPQTIGVEQVSFGPQTDFIKKIIENGIQLIIFGFLFIATGLVPLLIFIKKHEERVYFAFGFFAISIGMWAIIDSIKFIQLFFDTPKRMFDFLIVFPYLTPVGLCMYFEQIFSAGFKSIIRRLWQIQLINAAACMVILAFDLFSFPNLVRFNLIFFILFFVTIIVLLTTSVIAAIKGRTDARIITAGFIVFALLGSYDIIGGGFGLIPSWSQVIYPWGMLVFILSLGIVLERRFSEAHAQLQEYSKGLEIKVAERTHNLKEKNETLKNTLVELQSTQTKLVQSEKMAALGKLTAGIAHEINNPVGALKSTMDVLARCVAKMKKTRVPEKRYDEGGDTQKLFDILEENSRIALSASDRIARIVSSLKNFARLDEAEFQKTDIHEGIESTLTLIRHEKRDEIKVVKEYGNIPRIYCNPGELNQVFMTLLTNAVQAIKNKGMITIYTFADHENVCVRISDTGKGISPEKLKRLFEFSFTTKKSRVGMGMSLFNTYNIIQKHNGVINVESEPERGTMFTLILPINQNSPVETIA